MAVFRRILWTLGWGTAGLLIVAFLLGYAAPYLSPARFWWTDLFAVALLPLSLVTGGISLGLCVQGVYRRRWGRVVVSVGLLVLIAVRFSPRLAAWGASDLSPGTVQVMSLNVPPTFGRQSPHTPLTDLVREKGPDILAFQESRIKTAQASSQPTLTQVSFPIRPVLGDSFGYTPPRVLPPDTEIQQPVFGRLALDSTSVHPLPPRGATDARSRYTRTLFSWQGRAAALYNVHLHTVGPVRPWETISEGWGSLARWRTFLRAYRKGALRRAQQARLLRRQIAREPLPVIVVGDFNSTPHQWAYRHIAQGLQNAVTRRVRGWAATFPAQRPLVRIDHILASPAWEIVAAQVSASTDNAPISDHRPVHAHLRWKQR